MKFIPFWGTVRSYYHDYKFYGKQTDDEKTRKENILVENEQSWNDNYYVFLFGRSKTCGKLNQSQFLFLQKKY